MEEVQDLDFEAVKKKESVLDNLPPFSRVLKIKKMILLKLWDFFNCAEQPT